MCFASARDLNRFGNSKNVRRRHGAFDRLAPVAIQRKKTGFGPETQVLRSWQVKKSQAGVRLYAGWGLVSAFSRQSQVVGNPSARPVDFRVSQTEPTIPPGSANVKQIVRPQPAT